MASDYFLSIDGGPKGESTDKSHAGEIEFFSYSFGVSNPSTIGSGSTGGGGGKCSISSFNVMKRTDSASAPLFQACAAGDHWDTATVTIRKAGKEALEYLKYDFTEFYPDSVQWSGSAGGDDVPTESVSFSFASVHVTYVTKKSDGTGGSPIEGGWDVTTNQPK